MTLRTRILLGYGYLIVLLLLSVSVAAINSQRVAGNAKQILDLNIMSLGQAIEMLAQLERQDSETLLGLLQPSAGTLLEDAEHAFEVALAAASEASKATIADEDQERLLVVRAAFDEYRKLRAELLTRTFDDPGSAAEVYQAGTQQAFLQLKSEVNGYVTQKIDALKLANDEASRSAIEGAVLLGVLVAIALISLGFLSRSLQRDVLGRLTEVGHVTEAIAAGDRRRRVRDFYQDELGLVARQLNAALDRQHELESQMQGRLLEQRRVLVGLLNQWPTPAGMIGIDGELVASTLTLDDEEELHRLTPRVRMAAKVLMTRRFVKAEELAADIKASDGTRVVQIRALASGDNQIAGWLASFVLPRTRAQDPTGVFPVAPGSSDVFPVEPDTSGVRPVLRESGGLGPVPHAPNGLRPTAHTTTGPRPVARAVSGQVPAFTTPPPPTQPTPAPPVPPEFTLPTTPPDVAPPGPPSEFTPPTAPPVAPEFTPPPSPSEQTDQLDQGESAPASSGPADPPAKDRAPRS